jgi:hypothetical protein
MTPARGLGTLCRDVESLLLAYEYERQGFALEGGAYLPDFYLRQQGVWVEVRSRASKANA